MSNKNAGFSTGHGYSPNMQEEIRRTHRGGMSKVDLRRLYDLSKGQLKRILRGK